jgi:flagellin-specific chaperone FliS
LVEANINDSRDRLEHVVHLLSELREAWDTIATESETQVALPAAKVSLHG